MSSSSNDREKWVEYGLLVIGAFGTIFGVFTYFGASTLAAMSFLAGAGWLLVAPLLIMAARRRVELSRLETELKDVREQSYEWRLIATNDSDSLNKIISRTMPKPRAMARQPQNAPHIDANPGETQ